MIEGLIYIDEFLKPLEQKSLLAHLHGLTYYRDMFRGRRPRRSYAQFGFHYELTGRKLTSAELFPLFLRELATKAGPFCSKDEPVNQCIVTRYPTGAGIGWHTDARSFGNCIVGISIGGTAKLQFRTNGTEKVECELLLHSGSLYSMSGPARWDYQHRIAHVSEERYSITLRHVQKGIVAEKLFAGNGIGPSRDSSVARE